ncbi:hypothetical protein Vadar_006672 [Vaccinium darrowii]|uniref:Uncharacterized protein n=1 Tax=Vaccinium darrowii TaxID=229202 RepID=A0ACB7WYM7_9ERIC|nr:hypothetical protein Vadar_006672 [Vaccinium darrowii]
MEDGRYVCNCRQDDVIPDKLTEGYSGFVVNLWYRREVERACGDDALVLDSYRESFECFSKVESMEDALGSRLSFSTRVTLPQRIDYLVIEKLISFANSMLKDPKNADKKVLPIAVEVVVRTLQGSMESEQEAIARSFTESADEVLTDFLQPIIEEAIIEEDYKEVLEHVSAVRSKFKAVEYVRVPDSYLGKHCMFCNDEFSKGVFVARMPVCSHVYHGDCFLRVLALGESCRMCQASS